MKFLISVIILLLFYLPLTVLADIKITENSDGSLVVEGSVQEAFQVTGNVISLATEFGKQIGEYYEVMDPIDFSKGSTLQGPLNLTIARQDGTVGYYRINGTIYVFDHQDSLTETATNYSLRGIVMYKNKKGLWIAEKGAISLIK